MSVPKLGTGGSGTFNISLANALTKLASAPGSGGANTTFSSTAPGRATVVISSEDEVTFTISDATGRTVMNGKLNNYKGSGPTAVNTLSSWNCTVYDATTSMSGYGTVLVTTSVDSLGNTTSTWTDGAGRTLRTIDQLGKATIVTYDANGNRLSVRDPNNVGADMVYDLLNRNTQRTDTNSAVTKTEYDKAGNAVKLTDAKNNHTYVEFDARGRRIKTIDRLSGSTIFTYTALSQLATLKDAENQTTSYTYSTRGEKLTETFPDHTGGSTPGQPGYGIVTFVYDNAGRVLRKQDQLGDTCTYNYDFASRLTSRDYRTAANSPSSTISDSDTFTYDRASRMLTAVNGRYSNTVTYTYDLVGRKATESLTIGGQTYPITSEYNSRNELTKVTYPDSSISERSYHATGALNQLKLDGSTVSTRTYDDGHRLTGETLGNGVTESRTYFSDNLLDTISYGETGTAIGNLSYTWDENKNKKSETIGGVMSDYGFTSVGTTYDNEDRLTGFARTSGTFNQSWNLTAVGDWTSVTTNGTPQTRTHGPTHELLTAGGQNVTTDVKGNITLLPTSLTTSGVAAAYTYDFDNKLKTADVDNDTTVDVNFLYDALGRRVGRQGASGSFVFVQHDQQTIADYPYGGAPATPTYRYVYASYIDEPVVRKDAGAGGTIYYYHRTQQFSINAVTTSAGAVAERYAYTAYGQPTILNASATPIASSAIGNRYTYTGREWDQTLGLYHFRARWMSGLAGRFMGRDPIGYVDGWNLSRAYLGMAQTDPNGQTICKCTNTSVTFSGAGTAVSQRIIYRQTPNDCASLNMSINAIGSSYSSSCSPYTGLLTGLCDSKQTCCKLSNCEERVTQILNDIESTPTPSRFRNTLGSYLGFDAHCVTWTNSFLARDEPRQAIQDSCVGTMMSVTLDIPIPGGPEHSIVIVYSKNCDGTCNIFGIDNGMLGGDDHVFEIPITKAANGMPLPQVTIDQIDEWILQNRPSCSAPAKSGVSN